MIETAPALSKRKRLVYTERGGGRAHERKEERVRKRDGKEEGAPEGWYRLRAPSGFIETVGPVYWREAGDLPEMGFRVAPHLVNPVGFCHGGMLATFADLVLGFGFGHIVGNGAFVPTIGLTCEFLAPAPGASWVTGKAEVLRRGRRIGFGRCVLVCDAAGPVLHATGSFKLDRPADPEFSHWDYLTRD